jgi:hypothetical protein
MATIKGGSKFIGWLNQLKNKLLKEKVLQVGFMENAKYPDGTSVAMVAAIQEYGAPRANIPPRPYFRNMIAAKHKEWGPAIAGLLKQHNYDASATLLEAGDHIAEQLKQSIRDTNSPPLKPATIRARGGKGTEKFNPKDPKTFIAKPLIHTAQMINSVTRKIK